jgi:nucleoside-diphosphate-sugar epimerase
VKRVLLTGAGGFVGANLARRLLADGHRVHLVTSPSPDDWRIAGLPDASRSAVDLADAAAVDALLAEARPDWIFHLAAHGAYSWQTDVRRIVAANVVGAANLLESALAVGFESFVAAGSSSEYGFKETAQDERDPVDPNSAYAVSKAAATMLFRHASLAHGVSITTLRLYAVFGPWEDPKRLIPALVCNGVAGRLPPLVSPEIARDFVYVDDAVEAFVLAARAGLGGGEVLNVGSGVETTIAAAVESARTVFGLTAEPVWESMPDRAWDTRAWVSNPAKIEAALGWRATTSLPEGLALTADWLRSQPDLWPRYGFAPA